MSHFFVNIVRNTEVLGNSPYLTDYQLVTNWFISKGAPYSFSIFFKAFTFFLKIYTIFLKHIFI